MRNRVISALIMLPLLILIYIGGWALLALCFAASIAGIKEFFHAFENKGIKPSFGIVCASLSCLYLLNIYIYYLGDNNTDWYLYLLWLIISVSLSFFNTFRLTERSLEDSMVTLAGIVYIGFFGVHMVFMDQSANDGLFVWLILITSLGTDIMAYVSGKTIGKHKLCPNISPKKTVEGAIGGVIGSVGFCALFGFLLMPELIMHCIVLGVLGGLISQLGDLTASAIKRNLGVKDFSSLIPGHGGIMDRIDSILFTAPLVYYYTALLL